MAPDADSVEQAVTDLANVLDRLDAFTLDSLEEHRGELHALMPLLDAVRDQISIAVTGAGQASTKRLAMEDPADPSAHPDPKKVVGHVYLPRITIEVGTEGSPLIIREDPDPIWQQQVTEAIADVQRVIVEQQYCLIDNEGYTHGPHTLDTVDAGFVGAVADTLEAHLKNLALSVPYQDHQIEKVLQDVRRH